MATRPAGASQHHVKILDCTLRDGGYYNDWDYSFDLVKRYVDAMAAAQIDIVELGLRTLESDQYLGATAYTTDSFIERLQPAEGLSLAVMLNAKEVLAAADAKVAIRANFSRRSASRVGLVRIAANLHEVEGLGQALEELHVLGYETALNLMQVSEVTLAEITEFGRKAATFGVAFGYIADSFGSLRPGDIAPIMRALGEGFGSNIGCHLHDNMSYALANTMEAVDAGAVIVDATVQGMGRGPGNVRTEYVVMELTRRKQSHAKVSPLVTLVEHDFARMKRDFGWGSNLYYFQSANMAVHPTYVMELTKDERYSPSEIVSALDRLNEKGARSFDVRRLSEAVQGEPLAFAGGNEIDDWCTARDVLIVANGPEARAKRDEIEMFIRQHQPFVIGLNAHMPIDLALVDAVAVCHPERAVLDASALTALDCEVVAPRELLRELNISVRRHRDVAMRVTGGDFEMMLNGIGIPDPLAIGYALGLAAAGGAKRIFTVGVDGYVLGDPRHDAVQHTLDAFSRWSAKVELASLTRTTLDICQGSLFAPW